MSNGAKQTGLSCVVGAIPPEQRVAHKERTQRLFGRAVLNRQPSRNGYMYRLSVDETSEVGHFILLERLCCPFLTFALYVDGASSEISLEIDGPEGTREFIDAEFNA